MVYTRHVITSDVMVDFWRFIEFGIRSNQTKCRRDHNGAEDVELGKCLADVGVDAGDSRDAGGRGRFFPLTPEAHLIPGHMPPDFWFWNYTYYPMKSVSGLRVTEDHMACICISLRIYRFLA